MNLKAISKNTLLFTTALCFYGSLSYGQSEAKEPSKIVCEIDLEDDCLTEAVRELLANDLPILIKKVASGDTQVIEIKNVKKKKKQSVKERLREIQRIKTSLRADVRGHPQSSSKNHLKDTFRGAMK